jgi:ketol-acid reductoisomerase
MGSVCPGGRMKKFPNSLKSFLSENNAVLLCFIASVWFMTLLLVIIQIDKPQDKIIEILGAIGSWASAAGAFYAGWGIFKLKDNEKKELFEEKYKILKYIIDRSNLSFEKLSSEYKNKNELYLKCISYLENKSAIEMIEEIINSQNQQENKSFYEKKYDFNKIYRFLSEEGVKYFNEGYTDPSKACYMRFDFFMFLDCSPKHLKDEFNDLFHLGENISFFNEISDDIEKKIDLIKDINNIFKESNIFDKEIIMINGMIKDRIKIDIILNEKSASIEKIINNQKINIYLTGDFVDYLSIYKLN